jgi:peroxiredoxin Q/BCP
MAVELRKRKAHQQPSVEQPAQKKKASAQKLNKTIKAAAAKVKKAAADSEEPASEQLEESSKAPADKVGDMKAATPAHPKTYKEGDVVADLETFGGEVQTHEGKTTTLKDLLDESEKGVVLFTYPKASTPGCESHEVMSLPPYDANTRQGTTQVRLFRDAHDEIKAPGLSIYGLSADSAKANTTFHTKQELTYPLLCDQKRNLLRAIGLAKAPSGTTRGVFVINKDGKILLTRSGGPAATVNAVKGLLETM